MYVITALCVASMAMLLRVLVHRLHVLLHRETSYRGKQRMLRVFGWIRAAAKVQAEAPGDTGFELWLPVKWILDWQSPHPIASRWNLSLPNCKKKTLLKLRNVSYTHFMRQLAKIPTEDDLTLRRFGQIAWNIGQTEASLMEFSPTPLKIFNKHQLMEPTSYVSEEGLHELGELLTVETVVLIYIYCQVVRKLSTCANALYAPLR